MHQCNWRRIVSDRIYRIPIFPTQGTGPDVFGCLCRGTGSLFYCRALDVPFTDKGIQACRLKGSTAASGQSAVCRHTRALTCTVNCIVVVDDNDDDDSGSCCCYCFYLCHCYCHPNLSVADVFIIVVFRISTTIVVAVGIIIGVVFGFVITFGFLDDAVAIADTITMDVIVGVAFNCRIRLVSG